jgi:hypothetical protein
MFKDTEKTIGLVKNPQLGAPNFLLALGLCCFTEYWGRLLTGFATNQPSRCFNAFFDRLGQPYVEVRNNQNKIYHEVRCGLAHSYMIEGSSVIDMKSDLPCGIEYNDSTSQYVFHIYTYFEHFNNAVNDYIRGLENGTENVSCAEKALKNKPELV